MRNDKDRLKIRVSAYFMTDIDLERVEEDPRWIAMNNHKTVHPNEVDRELLFKYIAQYVMAGPELLTNAPFTNGPSTVWVNNMEIVDERPDSSIH